MLKLQSKAIQFADETLLWSKVWLCKAETGYNVCRSYDMILSSAKIPRRGTFSSWEKQFPRNRQTLWDWSFTCDKFALLLFRFERKLEKNSRLLKSLSLFFQTSFQINESWVSCRHFPSSRCSILSFYVNSITKFNRLKTQDMMSDLTVYDVVELFFNNACLERT